jgi:hypothetical protein
MAPRVSDAIKEDHREIESYYDRIIKSSDKDEQTRYQNLFTWELARHSIGEELVVYPALEKHVSGGTALAEKDRREHQSVSPNTYSLWYGIELANNISGQRTIEKISEYEAF